jgi:HK97 gp10 family phage protein
MANVHVTTVGMLHVADLSDEAVRQLTQAVARDMRRRAPVDTGELEKSIKVRRPRKGIGAIVIGTDHWAATEYGSAPHIIRAKGPYSLRNKETGQFFGRVVHHPGTPAQPFIRPALYQTRTAVVDL